MPMAQTKGSTAPSGDGNALSGTANNAPPNAPSTLPSKMPPSCTVETELMASCASRKTLGIKIAPATAPIAATAVKAKMTLSPSRNSSKKEAAQYSNAPPNSAPQKRKNTL